MSDAPSARSTWKTRRRSSHPCWTTRLLGRYSSLASARPRCSCRSSAGGRTGLRSSFAIRLVSIHSVRSDGRLRVFSSTRPLMFGEISPCGVSTRIIFGSLRLPAFLCTTHAAAVLKMRVFVDLAGGLPRLVGPGLPEESGMMHNRNR